MPRFWNRLIVAALLLATLGMGILWWRAGSKVSSAATREVMARWSQYAASVPLPQDYVVDSPFKVVELMNARSAEAFGKRKVHFVLWQPGAAAPPGEVVNPKPVDRKGEDEKIDALRRSPVWWRERGGLDPATPGSIASPSPTSAAGFSHPTAGARGVSRNSLAEQTAGYLESHAYRSRLIHGDVYIFREDALLPRIETRQIFLLPNPDARIQSQLRWLTPLADGKYDLGPLFAASGIAFRAGMSATYDPNGAVVTLALDEDSLDQADLILNSSCAGLDAASSRMGRVQIEAYLWYEERKERIKTRMGWVTP